MTRHESSSAQSNRMFELEYQVQKLTEALEELVGSSITCCPDYLEAVARDLPMNATVQGWHKADWIKLNKALEQARAALGEAR